MPPTDINLAYAIGLPPEKAIAYLESKGLKISWNWKDIWQEAQARAFTVAGITKLDVLQDIKDAVSDQLENGGTLSDFDKQLKPILQRKGWWGKDAQTNAETGEVAGKSLTPYRLKTIYQTNMQTAYMAGRYQSMMANVEDRPLWEYVAVLDNRTRPSHRALDGKVFRYDDPFWDSFYPPNGFNCRCRVRAHDAADLRDNKVYLSNAYGRMEDADIPISPRRSTDTVKVTGYRDPVSGKLFTPDAGWSYNVGKAANVNDIAIYDKAKQLLPAEVADNALAKIATNPAKLLEFDSWVDKAFAAAKPSNSSTVIGYMAQPEIDFANSKGKAIENGTLILQDSLLNSGKAKRHQSKGDALTVDEWKSVPRLLPTPDLVLWDVKNETVLYILPSQDKREIKITVDTWKVKKERGELAKSVFKLNKRDIEAGIKGGQYIKIR